MGTLMSQGKKRIKHVWGGNRGRIADRIGCLRNDVTASRCAIKGEGSELFWVSRTWEDEVLSV